MNDSQVPPIDVQFSGLPSSAAIVPASVADAVFELLLHAARTSSVIEVSSAIGV
jgi:hypothetical protein